MRRISFIKLSLLVLCFVFGCGLAAAQTNEFTYQGKLTDSGPPQATYDFEFRLCASETGDCSTMPVLLETKQRLGVAVTNGIFTVKLDFLAAHFTGADRFLEISVRRNSTEAWQPLLPRQKITSSPYSIKSLNATTADNSLQLGGTAANQFVQTNDTRLSDDRNPLPNSPNYIQNRTTPQPNSSFSIAQSGYIGGSLRIEGNGFIIPNTPSLSLSSSGIFQIDAPFSPSGRFVVLENGNVGIGNGAPAEKLDVAGNIKFTGSISGDGSGLGAIKWQSVSGLAQQAQRNNGYLTTNDAQVTITLPTAPSVGDIVRVSSSGAGGWKIAQNAGQSIIGTNIGLIGANWTPRESNRVWNSVASSADGSKLVAVVNGGQIYNSTDSGVSWAPREGNRYWNSVASSADGSKLVAVVSGGQIYTSTDSGRNWTPQESIRDWFSVASSADGTKLVAVVLDGQIYISLPRTTIGTAGYLTGGQFSAIELQYIGNGRFIPLSHSGTISGF